VCNLSYFQGSQYTNNSEHIHSSLSNHAHNTLHEPHHSYSNLAQLIWWLAEGITVGENGFGMKAVKSCGNNYWNKFVCFFFVHCVQSKGLHSRHELLLLTIVLLFYK
jgi:hypothetical protein